MKFLVLVFSVLLTPFAALAQDGRSVRHVHSQTCFGGRCGPSAPSAPQAPQYIQGPSVDLGRLEATTEALKDEQRYQTHLLYLMLSELQQQKLLASMAATKENAKDAAAADAARDAAIRAIRPTEIPDIRKLEATPLPDVRQVPPTVIPDPRRLEPTPLPDPAGVPPTPITGKKKEAAPTKPVIHRAWPQVARR